MTCPVWGLLSAFSYCFVLLKTHSSFYKKKRKYIYIAWHLHNCIILGGLLHFLFVHSWEDSSTSCLFIRERSRPCLFYLFLEWIPSVNFCEDSPMLFSSTLDDSHRTGTTEIVQQLKVVPHHSEAYLLTIFLINTLFGHTFTFLCCLQCSLQHF